MLGNDAPRSTVVWCSWAVAVHDGTCANAVAHGRIVLDLGYSMSPVYAEFVQTVHRLRVKRNGTLQSMYSSIVSVRNHSLFVSVLTAGNVNTLEPSRGRT